MVILMIGCSLFAGTGTAATSKDTIKYRHSVMQALSGHVNAFMLIALNKVEARQFLQGHADAVTNLSRELDGLFPKGSGEGDTDALPEIWGDSEKFAAAVIKMQESASALQEATRTGDNKTIMGAFATAGKACKGCHETFRAEDDDSDSHSH
jgi:cytochrome c556